MACLPHQSRFGFQQFLIFFDLKLTLKYSGRVYGEQDEAADDNPVRGDCTMFCKMCEDPKRVL